MFHIRIAIAFIIVFGIMIPGGFLIGSLYSIHIVPGYVYLWWLTSIKRLDYWASEVEWSGLDSHIQEIKDEIEYYE